MSATNFVRDLKHIRKYIFGAHDTAVVAVYVRVCEQQKKSSVANNRVYSVISLGDTMCDNIDEIYSLWAQVQTCRLSFSMHALLLTYTTRRQICVLVHKCFSSGRL